MNSYEREYFVSRIRAGFYLIKIDNVKVKVLTPTIEDEYLSNEVFMQAFDQARSDDIMTFDETVEWMIDRGLWSQEKDDKIEGLKKDIEKLKVDIFNHRNDIRMRESARALLRAAEKVLTKVQSEKDDLFSKSCEGIAIQEKTMYLFEKSCFVGSEPLDISCIDLSSLYYQYNQLQLSETQLRELARNDPWRLCWYTKDHTPLFANEKYRTLSNDQKGILIWANMYDNIQESMDCPTEDVINDDDMLDGWFIVQRRKQQHAKAQSELESKTSNDKIARSDEILIMANSKQEAEKIHSMNSVGGEIIRKQRLNTVKARGSAQDLDFQDRKIEVMNMQRDAQRNKSRR
jgi:hypothetical protein